MLHPVYLAAYIAVGLVAVLACVAASRYYQLFQREKDLTTTLRAAFKDADAYIDRLESDVSLLLQEKAANEQR